MNEISSWFSSQLQSTLEGMVWSAQQVPLERWLRTPPGVFGDWPAARHLFHMCFYEETIALPSMRIWLGDPKPDVMVDEEKAWEMLEDSSMDGLCQRFASIR